MVALETYKANDTFDVFCDVHEPLRIVQLLRQYGLKVCRVRLPISDYTYSETAIERKSLADFLASVKSARIWTQLKNMKDNYKHCYLLISGTPKDLYNFKAFSKEDLIGSIAAVLVGFGIPVVGVDNDEDLALLIYKIWQRDSKKGKTHRPIPKVRKGASMPERIENILGQIEKVGPSRAKALLKEFESIVKISSLDINQLSEAVPKKVAEKVNETLSYKVKYVDSNE